MQKIVRPPNVEVSQYYEVNKKVNRAFGFIIY